MNRVTVSTSIEFSPNQVLTTKLSSIPYVSHIDCSLVARIHSFYNSMPTRRKWGNELESIPKARRNAFPLLIRSLQIRDPKRKNIAVRYRDGYEWFRFLRYRMGGLKIGILPMWGHTRKIQTEAIIHPGFLLPDEPHYRWDMSRVLPTSTYSEFALGWADASALGSNYQIEWARLDLCIYGYEKKEKEAKDG